MSLFVKNNSDYFKFKIKINRSLRPRSPKLCLKECDTALVSKNMLGMAPRIYNRLPSQMKELTVSMFKKQLKKLLVDKCYYCIQDFLNDDHL